MGDVFTPTSSAHLTYIKRNNIEKEFLKNLKIPGMQVIIYGHSGGGKTTTVNYLLKKEKIKYITISCIDGYTVDKIMLEAFDKLNPYYMDEKSSKNTISLKNSIKQDYLNIQGQLSSKYESESSSKQKRALPLQLTPNRLIDFLGAAGFILVIEDFHKVDIKEKKKLSQIMKLFKDASDRYKNIKIIAIGAVNSAREVVDYDQELRSRVFELKIPLLGETELKQIVNKGMELLNVDASSCVYEVIKYSNHLGSICHQLCYNMCYDNEIEKTSVKSIKLNKSDLKKAVESYIEQNSDTFKKKYDRALKQKSGKYRNVELIFKAMIKFNKNDYEYNEILSEIKKYDKNYPQGNLSAYLRKLATPEYDEIIRYDLNSGKYSFSDPFFQAYVEMSLGSNMVPTQTSFYDLFEKIRLNVIQE